MLTSAVLKRTGSLEVSDYPHSSAYEFVTTLTETVEITHDFWISFEACDNNVWSDSVPDSSLYWSGGNSSHYIRNDKAWISVDLSSKPIVGYFKLKFLLEAGLSSVEQKEIIDKNLRQVRFIDKIEPYYTSSYPTDFTHEVIENKIVLKGNEDAPNMGVKILIDPVTSDDVEFKGPYSDTSLSGVTNGFLNYYHYNNTRIKDIDQNTGYNSSGYVINSTSRTQYSRTGWAKISLDPDSKMEARLYIEDEFDSNTDDTLYGRCFDKEGNYLFTWYPDNVEGTSYTDEGDYIVTMEFTDIPYSGSETWGFISITLQSSDTYSGTYKNKLVKRNDHYIKNTWFLNDLMHPRDLDFSDEEVEITLENLNYDTRYRLQMFIVADPNDWDPPNTFGAIMAHYNLDITTEPEPDKTPVINGVKSREVYQGSVIDFMYGVTAKDYEGRSITNDVIVNESVNTGTLGEYGVTYQVSADGETAEESCTFTVIEVPEPEFFGHGVGVEVYQNEEESIIEEAILDNVTAIDGNGNTLAITIDWSNFDRTTVSKQSVYLKATATYEQDGADSIDKEAEVERAVETLEIIPPVITLTTTKFEYYESDTPPDFTEGVSADDPQEGDITSKIITDDSNVGSTEGSYTISYTVENKYGAFDEAFAEVKIYEDPVPSISGAKNHVYTAAEEENHDFLEGVEAWCEYDGDLTDDVTVEESVDFNTPGEYPVTFSVTNSYNKSDTVEVTYTIEAQSGPEFFGTNDKTLDYYSTFDPREGVSVSDEHDSNLASDDFTVTDEDNYDKTRSGEYRFTYFAENVDGYNTTVVRTITVSQAPAPTISGVIDKRERYKNEEFAILEGMSVTDQYDSNPSFGYSINWNGNDYELSNDVVKPLITGTLVVTYTAVNMDGVETTKTTEVTVTQSDHPTFRGISDEVIYQGYSFEPMDGVTATDYEGKDLTDSIQYTDDDGFDNQTPGDYSFTYTVTDEFDTRSSTTRVVTVLDGDEPQISFEDIPADPLLGDSEEDHETINVLEGVTAYDPVDNDRDLTSGISYTVVDENNNSVSLTDDVLASAEEAAFTVTYAVSNEYTTVYRTRTIAFTRADAPKISMVEDHNTNITVPFRGSINKESIITNVQVKDSYDKNIELNVEDNVVEPDEEINTDDWNNWNEPYTYKVTYTNSKGVTSEFERVVSIKDPEKPKFRNLPTEHSIYLNDTVNLVRDLSTSSSEEIKGVDSEFLMDLTYPDYLDVIVERYDEDLDDYVGISIDVEAWQPENTGEYRVTYNAQYQYADSSDGSTYSGKPNIAQIPFVVEPPPSPELLFKGEPIDQDTDLSLSFEYMSDITSQKILEDLTSYDPAEDGETITLNENHITDGFDTISSTTPGTTTVTITVTNDFYETTTSITRDVTVEEPHEPELSNVRNRSFEWDKDYDLLKDIKAYDSPEREEAKTPTLSDDGGFDNYEPGTYTIEVSYTNYHEQTVTETYEATVGNPPKARIYMDDDVSNSIDRDVPVFEEMTEGEIEAMLKSDVIALSPYEDTFITEDIEVVGTIDDTIIGEEQDIELNVTDMFGQTTVFYRRFTINDYPPPSITYDETVLREFQVGETIRESALFDHPDVDANDPYSENITLNAENPDNLPLDTELTVDDLGTYSIRYVATNDQDKTSELNLDFKVIEAKEPRVVSVETFDDTIVVGFNQQSEIEDRLAEPPYQEIVIEDINGEIYNQPITWVIPDKAPTTPGTHTIKGEFEWPADPDTGELLVDPEGMPNETEITLEVQTGIKFQYMDLNNPSKNLVLKTTELPLPHLYIFEIKREGTIIEIRWVGTNIHDFYSFQLMEDERLLHEPSDDDSSKTIKLDLAHEENQHLLDSTMTVTLTVFDRNNVEYYTKELSMDIPARLAGENVYDRISLFNDNQKIDNAYSKNKLVQNVFIKRGNAWYKF